MTELTVPRVLYEAVGAMTPGNPYPPCEQCQKNVQGADRTPTLNILEPAMKKEANRFLEPFFTTRQEESGSVLVMDDEEDIREIVQAILEELGYTVESVKNGSEAVDLYRKRKEQGTPFSAVILDLTIPGGMGGKEAIKKLLKIDRNIKAIVSSGYSTDPIVANFRDYGFSAVLCKPFLPQEISNILQEVLAL